MRLERAADERTPDPHPASVPSVMLDDAGLVKRVYSAAYRSAFRVLLDSHSAEEIAQEACARLVANSSRVRWGQDNWVSRVATNLALSEARRQRRRRAGLALMASTASSEEREHSLDLLDAINRLPRRQREVISLRYFADLSLKDVAELLGCSVGSVNKHASRAMASLRTSLGDDYLADGMKGY